MNPSLSFKTLKSLVIFYVIIFIAGIVIMAITVYIPDKISFKKAHSVTQNILKKSVQLQSPVRVIGPQGTDTGVEEESVLAAHYRSLGYLWPDHTATFMAQSVWERGQTLTVYYDDTASVNKTTGEYYYYAPQYTLDESLGSLPQKFDRAPTRSVDVNGVRWQLFQDDRGFVQTFGSKAGLTLELKQDMAPSTVDSVIAIISNIK